MIKICRFKPKMVPNLNYLNIKNPDLYGAILFTYNFNTCIQNLQDRFYKSTIELFYKLTLFLVTQIQSYSFTIWFVLREVWE